RRVLRKARRVERGPGLHRVERELPHVVDLAGGGPVVGGEGGGPGGGQAAENGLRDGLPVDRREQRLADRGRRQHRVARVELQLLHRRGGAPGVERDALLVLQLAQRLVRQVERVDV